jgi:flagellar biogenesis protein FliO
MRDSYLTFSQPWRLIVLCLMGLGMALLFTANTSHVFADDLSPLYQQAAPGAASSQALPLPDAASSPSPSLIGTFLRLVLTLVLIVALIFATVWGLKLILEKRGINSPEDENKPVKLLTSTYLAPRKAIHLVEVGKRILVLGVGNDEINKLDVITDPEEMAMIHQSIQVGFPNILDRLLQREVADKTDEETERMIIESNETVDGYVEKL